MHKIYNNNFLTALLFLSLLPSCIPVALTGVGTVGTTIAQERTTGDAIDDATIATQIQGKYLSKDVNNLFHAIDVDVTEGRVLLTGNVKEQKHKIEAEKIAWESKNVKEVINEINITDRTSYTNYASDTAITSEVVSKIILTKGIRSLNYSVDTLDSVVYIFGIAQDDKELNRVINIARKIKGVDRVVSHVRLKSDPRRH